MTGIAAGDFDNLVDSKIEDRLARLEAEQDQVISEAKGAAGAAATMIAVSIVSDVVTRITRIEERTARLTDDRKQGA